MRRTAIPGLLGPEVDMQIGINYMRYVGESNFAGVKFGRRAGDHGRVGGRSAVFAATGQSRVPMSTVC